MLASARFLQDSSESKFGVNPHYAGALTQHRRPQKLPREHGGLLELCALPTLPEIEVQKRGGDAFGEMSPDEMPLELLACRGEESHSWGRVSALWWMQLPRALGTSALSRAEVIGTWPQGQSWEHLEQPPGALAQAPAR